MAVCSRARLSGSVVLERRGLENFCRLLSKPDFCPVSFAILLVDQLGAPSVIEAIDRLVDEHSADVTISTAHKAKGREWETVRISGDFHQPKDEDAGLSREEAMLAYVAVTRAKLILDRSGLAFIDSLLGLEMPTEKESAADLLATDQYVNVAPSISQPEPPAPVEEKKMANVTVTGKYQKHEVSGETEVGGKGALKVSAWNLPDGKSAPKGAGLVGKSFDTVGKAGVEVIKAIRVHDKLSPLPTDMRMIFFASGASQPVNARNVGGEKPAKAEKPAAAKATTNGSTPKAGKGKSKASPKADAPTSGGANSRKAGAVRTRNYRLIKRMSDEAQVGVTAGRAKFFCDACNKAFSAKTPKGADGRWTPDACPEGHRTDDAELTGSVGRPERERKQPEPVEEPELEELTI